MAFRLFVDSSTGVTVYPEWNFEQDTTKIEDEHRARSGARYVYKWGQYEKFKFSVSWVNSEFRSIVNSWWSTNTKLLFMEEGSTEVYSVQLVGDLPVNEYMKPYRDQFGGVIELEGY